LSENKRLYLWAIFELFHGTLAQLEEELTRFQLTEETKLVITNLKTVSSIGLKRLRSLHDISFNQADPFQWKDVLEEMSKKILEKTLPEQCYLSNDSKELLGGSPDKET